ncbi:toxin glutamine deamidase domain-containing protein [Streptomyces sp. NPDC004296]|uniref:toxin glutamine deamidase domain-containing protein n=1 Tax=Streptomyces sp. NPDC004296 TaxID=3364697 RepID=UPI0036B9F1D1
MEDRRGRHSDGRGSSPDRGRKEPEFGTPADKPDEARNDSSTPDDEARSGRQHHYGRYRGGRPNEPAGDESSRDQPVSSPSNEGPEHTTPDQHGPEQGTPDQQVSQGDNSQLSPDQGTEEPDSGTPADNTADKPDSVPNDSSTPDAELNPDGQPKPDGQSDSAQDQAPGKDQVPNDLPADQKPENSDQKPDDKQSDGKQSDGKDEPEAHKPDAEHGNGPSPDSTKPESESPDPSKSDDSTPDNNQADNKQADDKAPDGNKPDGDKSEDGGPDDVKSGADNKDDDSSADDSNADDKGSSDTGTDDRPSLDDIRDGIPEGPGGLLPPDAADQHALESAVPKNDDGTPQRFPDPFGDWSQLQNDGGPGVPGRSNNCADCSRSFLETWYGNPQVSAPRTQDLNPDGSLDSWSPEANANENMVDWTGAEHTWAGSGPDGHDLIAQDLLYLGPGSSAAVQVNWADGGGHAFNAVNHNGNIVWVDTQSGEVSYQPINTEGATDVFYIPLDANRNPVPEASDPDTGSLGPDDAHSTMSDQSTYSQQSYDNNQFADPHLSNDTQPNSAPDDHGPTPDANDPAKQPQHEADPGEGSGQGNDRGDGPANTSTDPNSSPDGTPHTPDGDHTTPPNPNTNPNSASAPDTQSPANDHQQSTSLASDAPTGRPAEGPPPHGYPPARDADPTRDGLNQPTSGRPDAPVPGTPDGRPGQTSPDARANDARPNDVRPNQTPPATRPKPPAPEAPAGKRKASGPPTQDNSDSDSNPDSNPVQNKKRKSEPDNEGLAALHLNDANVSSSASSASASASPPKHDDDAMDVDKEPYSDPQDRGDSDTSKQEQEGKHTLDAEKEGSKEYGIPPDRLQNELRRDRDVHRIPLDRVHGNLDRWANDGSLAQVLRASTGDAKSPSPDAGKGPRAFPQSDLEKRLPGFKDLDRGERLAVVSSLARLSVGFHDQHGVGKNPEHIDRPYRNKGEGDPQEKTKDSVAKNSDESLGVRGHRKSSEKFLDNLKVTGNMPPSLRHNSPDLTDRNYAALEVEGPPPERETHYVSDSSVPVGEKYVSGRHSEKHLVDWLKRVNQGDKQYTLKSVYTEREPCGNGQGHAKCSTVLRSQGLDGTKVYYSTTYRTDPEDVAAKKRLDTEKKVEKKKVDGMLSTEVRENLEDRINSRTDRSAEWKAKEIAAAKAKSDADVREDLRKDVEREFKKRKEDATTDAKHAMVREMDRHIDHLDSLWTKIQPSLM